MTSRGKLEVHCAPKRRGDRATSFARDGWRCSQWPVTFIRSDGSPKDGLSRNRWEKGWSLCADVRFGCFGWFREPQHYIWRFTNMRWGVTWRSWTRCWNMELILALKLRRHHKLTKFLSSATIWNIKAEPHRRRRRSVLITRPPYSLLWSSSHLSISKVCIPLSWQAELCSTGLSILFVFPNALPLVWDLEPVSYYYAWPLLLLLL